MTTHTAHRDPSAARACLRLRRTSGVHVVVGADREVDRPRRLVCTRAWQEADGTTGPESVVTVELRADGDATTVELEHAGRPSRGSADRHAIGWPGTFENLARPRVPKPRSRRLVMAYDEDLAQRLRARLAEEDGLTEKAMFGGLAFLLAGNMAVGISGEELMVRVGRDATDDALARPHTRPFDMTGRPMRGWIIVAPGGVHSDDDLDAWVARGVTFARSLPPKA